MAAAGGGFYYATSQKSTAVTHAAVGTLTGSLNLVLVKTSRIEIHAVTPEGLTPVCDVPVYGRIATMRIVRPAVRGVVPG